MRTEYPKEFKVEGPQDKVDGRYFIPSPNIRTYLFHVIVGTGEGWEHLSVTIRTRTTKLLTKLVERTPTWAEMCFLKDVFWSPDECVVQFHPPKINHISNHDFCLHLWRSADHEFPVPPSILVGSNKIDALLTAMHKIRPNFTREELADALFLYANKERVSEFPEDADGINTLATTIFQEL